MLQPSQPNRTAEPSPLAPPSDPIAALRAALRGHYDIERELGQGAFATVYLARDLKHERKVAIKVLHADPTSDIGELRFIREIRLLARLQHPNILALHDSGHVETLLYYVMPYIGGETLRDRIDAEKQLPVEVACNIARDVADALSCAHGQGIIHRDIKPENILLSAGHPILADFGIARVIDLAGVRQLTRTGVASPGTPAYMSPEQLMGDRELDGRSDMYSLGCVLFEMLTGRPPFAGKEGFVKRFTEAPPSAIAIRRDLPPWIDRLLSKALARTPADRYSTAAEFVTALCPPIDSASHTGQPTNRESPLSNTITDEAVVADARAPATIFHRLGNAINKHRTGAAVSIAVISISILTTIAAVASGVNLRVPFGRAPSLDSTRFIVIPMAVDRPGDQQVASRLSDGFYDVLNSNWDGLKVVAATEVQESVRKRGHTPITQSEAVELARQFGARKVIWGQVISPSRIRTTLYDAANGTQETEISLDRAPESRAEFARAASELLRVRDRPAAADGGDIGTRSYTAWRAYGTGHVAFARWDLAAAEADFSAAVADDPNFAAAQLWLAQTRALRSYGAVEAWAEPASRALSIPRGLHKRDSSLANALSSMATGEYGEACKWYRQLAISDPRDFIAWYGLGLCGLADKALVADPQRHGIWQFRSSFLRAGQAFDKATQLEPRLFTVLPFDTLLRVAPIHASQLRVGITNDRSRELFLAYPSVAGDTLAYTPFPLADVQSGRLQTAPRTAGIAAQRSRAFLLRIVVRWIREFPESAEAQEALSIVQEAAGELQVDREGIPSALTAALNAQRLSHDPTRRTELVVREIRLRLKRNEFERARLLSDSLLSRPSTTIQSADLAGLAALTGRLSLAERLLPPSAVVTGQFDPTALPTDAIMADAVALFVRTALGACHENLDGVAAHLDSLLESYVSRPKQREIRQGLTERSWSMATPCNSKYALRATAPVDRLLRMQQAFARSQLNVVRAGFDSLVRLRENDRPGDVSADVMYQEASLLAAIGDTAAAIRQLDLSLSALPTLGDLILEQIPQAAGLVRAMILRADLALAGRDEAAAHKWARAVTLLWANADPALLADVQRMRSMLPPARKAVDKNQSLGR